MEIKRIRRLISLLPCSLLLISCSCHNSPDPALVGNWIEQSDFEGVARSDAASFTIGNLGYVGTGYDGEVRLKDFWYYDPDRNSWTQITDFSGRARNAAVGFSAAGKGFVGTGYDGESKLGDFWQYDPGSNTWDSVTATEGPSARYSAVAFSINDIGYVGTGYDGNYLKDIWAYDPATNQWHQKNSFGGSKRRDAVSFVIDGKGYICTGINNGTYEKEFYMYDPGTDLWTAKRKIADVSDQSYDDNYAIIRSNAVAFVMGGKAYIATGTIGSLRNDVWEYDPLSDLWKTKTNFEGSTRTDAVAFTTDNGRAFVVTGKVQAINLTIYGSSNPMTNITRKTKVFRLLLIIFAIAFISFVAYQTIHNNRSSGTLNVETFRVPGGWGYEILIGRKVYIYQPFIPVLPGKKPFPDRQSALRVANVVKSNILLHKTPGLTREDIMNAGLDSLGNSN